ncbi:YbhB/YbcL family Raf kinase inhibitor-like protein [Butyrivibrio sp. AE2032]|uniref:YbhB/YbcL family Raf kinase inhibitor-like protein n=1 Tax=Butyrivibrio sp. AE2032 TaxID=1458463 RepID=UPI00054FEEDA|nr:YbhB/YbcL family Raf kinase inhibitor-like protein [Butyrivibrio sp. AE2032]
MKKILTPAALILTAAIALCGCGSSPAPTAFESQLKTETKTVNVAEGMFPSVIDMETTYLQDEPNGEWKAASEVISGMRLADDFDISDSVWKITSDDATTLFSGLDSSLKGVKAALYLHFSTDAKDITAERVVNGDGTSKMAVKLNTTADALFDCNGTKFNVFDVKIISADVDPDGSAKITANVDGGEGIINVPANVSKCEMKDYLIRQSSTYITVVSFEDLPTFSVTSSDLINGVWDNKISNTGVGENISPELTWDAVDGATQYVVIMIDGGWLHMDVFTSETSLASGTIGRGERGAQYVGPYPPKNDPHTYTVFVFALKNEPGNVRFGFDSGSNNLDTIYKGLDADVDGNSGNVLAYARLDGNFTLRG